jgi:hypothetical protein
MEITGKITHILDTRTGSGTKGDWTVYSYVLQPDGQYAKPIAFEVFNTDHGLMIGDTVTAHINIESREHNGKWYTSVKAYKVDVQGDKQAPAQTKQTPIDDDNPDDLPF